MIANARMYSVAPAAAAAWRALLERVARDAGVAMEVIDYPAPQPLDVLWARDDLGCVQMCGYPYAMASPRPALIATPVPTRFGEPVYASDFVVRADSPFRTLEDTFGHRIGWTVHHSQSGFNAARHHLLRYRTPERPRLYAQSVGDLVTARAIVQRVLDGTIDVGPLDAWWHELLKLHEPETTTQLRTVATTATVPAPPLVAAPGTDPAVVASLRRALLALPPEPALALQGYAWVPRGAYDITLDWAREAEAAGYPEPA